MAKKKPAPLSDTERLLLGLEAQIKRLKADYDADVKGLTATLSATRKALGESTLHCDRILGYAIEGKDPLSGEEPEFWLVGVLSGVTGMNGHAVRRPSRESAIAEAERLSRENVGAKFYLLPAFDYAVCEVSPVV